MEILMKLKCSPTPARSPHLLKNVDRLQQQQQQQQRNSSPLQKLQQQQQQMQQHMNYNATNINCCTTTADYMQGRFCSTGSCCAPQIPACCTSGVARHAIGHQQMNYNNNSVANEDYNYDQEHKFEYKEPEENFVSIDDIKIKSFLMKIGQEQRKKEAEQKKQEEAEMTKKLNINKKPTVVYEIIDLDDEEEREKLKRIKNQGVENTIITNKSLLNKNQFKNVNEDILQQVQQQQQQQQMRLKMQQKEQQQQQQLARQSPNISLVPAAQKTSQQQKEKRREKQQKTEGKLRIIAEIDLLDSSDEDEFDDEDEPTQDEGNHVFHVMSDDEGNDALVPATIDDDDEDDDEIPLAAAAVSCELECDDNDDYSQQQQQHQQKTKIKIKRNYNDNTHCVMASDEDNDDYVDEHEEGLVVRWDELELEQEQRNATTARNVYECFICGKRVQSNYNLRRHMMIHTGEC